MVAGVGGAVRGAIVKDFGKVTAHTAIFKMHNQQKPIVQHMELCSVLCASLDGRRVGGRIDACKCMAESLHCSPETITTSLISYTPIQKVFGVNKMKFKKKTVMVKYQVF